MSTETKPRRRSPKPVSAGYVEALRSVIDDLRNEAALYGTSESNTSGRLDSGEAGRLQARALKNYADRLEFRVQHLTNTGGAR